MNLEIRTYEGRQFLYCVETGERVNNVIVQRVDVSVSTFGPSRVEFSAELIASVAQAGSPPLVAFPLSEQQLADQIASQARVNPSIFNMQPRQHSSIENDMVTFAAATRDDAARDDAIRDAVLRESRWHSLIQGWPPFLGFNPARVDNPGDSFAAKAVKKTKQTEDSVRHISFTDDEIDVEFLTDYSKPPNQIIEP